MRLRAIIYGVRYGLRRLTCRHRHMAYTMIDVGGYYTLRVGRCTRCGYEPPLNQVGVISMTSVR